MCHSDGWPMAQIAKNLELIVAIRHRPDARVCRINIIDINSKHKIVLYERFCQENLNITLLTFNIFYCMIQLLFVEKVLLKSIDEGGHWPLVFRVSVLWAVSALTSVTVQPNHEYVYVCWLVTNHLSIPTATCLFIVSDKSLRDKSCISKIITLYHTMSWTFFLH